MFEAGDYAGGHTNTVRVDTPERDPPRRHRLHRLQRPQLPELRAPAGAPRRRLAALDDELQRQRRARRLRVQGQLAQRPVRQARATSSRPGFTAWWPTWCASTAPPASCCGRPPDEGPSLGQWLEQQRFSPPLHRPADRPSGLRGVVGRSAPDVELPRALHGRVLRQSRHARAPRPAPLANRPGGSARYVEALTRRFSGRLRLGTPGQRVTPPRRPRARHARGRRARALRRGGARHPLRPGAAPARRRHATASTRSSARSPTRPTRPCCTPTCRLLPRRRRAWASWNYHLRRAARAARRSPTT